MVTSTELTFDRRVAILSETGLLVLQQRYVHHLTRAVMQLERLERACGHVLAEAELQEEWCSELVPQRVQGGDPREARRPHRGRLDSGGTHEEFTLPAARRRRRRIKLEQS
jgi:hypothetical protein